MVTASTMRRALAPRYSCVAAAARVPSNPLRLGASSASMLSSSSSPQTPTSRPLLVRPSAASCGLLSIHPCACHHPGGSKRRVTGETFPGRGASVRAASAPAMAAAAVSASQPGLAAIVAWASAALSAALTVFLLCAIPTLVAIRRAAVDVARLARALELEVPDTAASVRLTGLELADTAGELGALGADVTAGVRASALALADAASAAASAPAAVASLGPVVKKSVVPRVSGAAVPVLRERAALPRSLSKGPTVSEVASAARAGAKLARGALKAGGILRLADGLLGLVSVDNLAERANMDYYGGERGSGGVYRGSGGGGGVVVGDGAGSSGGPGRRRRRRPPPIPGESDSDAAAV